MLRQASSRNQRNKGFNVKHALQISLLIAVCIWLLYQVKHSHEKKRALEESNTNSLNKEIENSQADVVKFGRKDLPHIEKTGFVQEVHNNEEEGEEPKEEEEHETKQEEIEDEERRDKRDDDDIDEHDQEKEDDDSERDQEESTEEEDKSSHDEEKDGHDEFESQDHEGGTQEAREENYKRDDASSAVVHDTHATEFEQVVDKVDDDSGVNDSKGDEDSNANGSEQDDNSASSDGSENEVTSDSKGDEDSNANGSKHDDNTASSDGSEDGVINDSKGDEDSNANGSKHEDNTASSDGSEDEVIGNNLENKSVEAENVTNNANDLVVGGSASNVSDSLPKDDETTLTDNPFSNVTSADINNTEVESKPDNGSVTNPVPTESNNQREQQSTMVTELLANSTRVEIDNSTVVNASNYNVSLNSAEYRNSTVDNDALNLESFEGDSVENSTTTAVSAIKNTTTTSTFESRDAAQGESNDISYPIITEEEKGVGTDLSTLPDIQNVVKSTDDEASEQ